MRPASLQDIHAWVAENSLYTEPLPIQNIQEVMNVLVRRRECPAAVLLPTLALTASLCHSLHLSL